MFKQFTRRSIAMIALAAAAALAMPALQGCANGVFGAAKPGAAASAPMSAADAAAAQQKALTTSIGKSIQIVTIARTAATQAATNKAITWAQDDKAQAALSLITATLKRALGMVPTDPVQAGQLLAGALSDLADYQQQQGGSK